MLHLKTCSLFIEITSSTLAYGSSTGDENTLYADTTRYVAGGLNLHSASGLVLRPLCDTFYGRKTTSYMSNHNEVSEALGAVHKNGAADRARVASGSEQLTEKRPRQATRKAPVPPAANTRGKRHQGSTDGQQEHEAVLLP
jgi:hypothetical protein